MAESEVRCSKVELGHFREKRGDEARVEAAGMAGYEFLT